MWGMMENGKITERDQKQYKLSREILDIKHFFLNTKYQRSLVSHIKYTDSIFKQIHFSLSLETSLKYVILHKRFWDNFKFVVFKK